MPKKNEEYHNDPKFSDRYACSSRSSLIRVYTVCHSVCIVWTHYSMVEPHSSKFRVITTNCLGVRIFRKFMVILVLQHGQNETTEKVSKTGTVKMVQHHPVQVQNHKEWL